MYKIRFILSIILLLIFSFNYSQENLASCGTIMPENYNEIELNSKSSYDYYLNEFYDKYQNKTSTALTDVPAKLHIVTDDGGDTSITVDTKTNNPKIDTETIIISIILNCSSIIIYFYSLKLSLDFLNLFFHIKFHFH